MVRSSAVMAAMFDSRLIRAPHGTRSATATDHAQRHHTLSGSIYDPRAGDVKGANILVGQDGQARLADFGRYTK